MYSSKLSLLLLGLGFLSCTAEMERSSDDLVIKNAPSAIGTKENPHERVEFELMQTVNPNTGMLPVNIHSKELRFARALNAALPSNARTSTLDWEAIGPFNVGGRTRALALDATNEDVIIAGGVSGGMWRSEDAGSTWVRTSHPAALNSTTCLVQDLSEGYENIWYHGTGELRGNSARIDATPYRGDGIFKSIDGGRSWDLLPSTAFGLYSEFDSPFNYVWNLQVMPNETGAGEIYAALYGGIVRSSDGGESWETVLGQDLINSSLDDLNESGASFYTNVMITPSNVLYATLSTSISEGDSLDNKGIFRSTDGTSWQNITPPGFRREHDRMVMAYAPSDEEILYFFVNRNDVVDLWCYDHGVWFIRNEGLPDGEDIAPVETQNGYNMVIKVHPADPDVVFLGATNLYRSTDGFRSASNTRHIGGYEPGEPGQVYTRHHPDQHEIVFYPSNPDKMLTANDGGVRLTNANRSNDVSWLSLNNGFVTSQFYTISLAKDEGGGGVIGGLQDNGSYLRTLNGSSLWFRLLGGDGSYCSTVPGAGHMYVSFQNGQTFRIKVDEDNDLASFSEVDPVGGGGYLFINPFVLDPNNYNRMYMAGGNVLWRNDNLSQIPLGRQEPTTVGWTKISETTLNGMLISTLDISTHPADVVYYGTAQGFVFRLDDANTGAAERTQVYSASGYVSCVSVDPTDANHVMFAYGNYGIPSVFVSTDGGLSVDDVGGNLEENTNGTGNGPSVRWCEIVPLENGAYQYFVGTSIGLFSTRELDAQNTIWQQEGIETIGNSVIRMMDWRSSDGKIVVATHGNGVFESYVPDALEVQPHFEPVENLTLVPGFPNPFDDTFTIRFSLPEEGHVEVNVMNTAGQIMKNLLDTEQFAGQVYVSWDGTNASGMPVQSGLYYYQILYRGNQWGGKMLLARD